MTGWGPVPGPGPVWGRGRSVPSPSDPLSERDWLSVGLVCPYSFSHPGGVQNHVLGLASWLRRQGHVVHILGPGHPGRGRLEELGLPPESFSSTGLTVPVAVNGSTARIGIGARTAVRVHGWLDSHHFDVIHVHEPMNPSTSLLTLWNADRPLVATFHAATAETPVLRAARRLAPSSVARIDDAIAVSGAAAATATRIWRVHPVIIGNGVDVARLTSVGTPRSDAPWRTGRPTVLFLGRFEEPRKGFDAFAEAVGRVRRTWPELDAVVVGPGQVPAREGIRFLGALSDDGRDAVLAAADVYVAPNTGGESFGIVLVEAMAAGASVVASDLPGFREVLTDDRGLVGRLVPVGDVSALASAVGEALTDRSRGADDPDRARRRAAEFDWGQVGPRIVRRYRTAIEVRADRTARRPRWTDRLGWGS